MAQRLRTRVAKKVIALKFSSRTTELRGMRLRDRAAGKRRVRSFAGTARPEKTTEDRETGAEERRSFRRSTQTRIDCGRVASKIAGRNVNFDGARASVVSRAAKAGKWVTYTAHSGSRVNEDDTGLGEFRTG